MMHLDGAKASLMTFQISRFHSYSLYDKICIEQLPEHAIKLHRTFATIALQGTIALAAHGSRAWIFLPF